MPTPGLSLVGFMDQPGGIEHFRQRCVVADESDAALVAEWQSAQQRLGSPMANPGKPNIQQLSAAGTAHVANLVQQPWVQAAFQSQPALLGASFQLVEIDPLLAFQVTVDTARSNYHNGGSVAAPTADELLNMCLPLAQAVEQLKIHQSPGSMMVTSRNLNFRTMQAGFLNGAFLGMHVALSLPFVHVVRLNGRCYLHNGFHRAIGLRARGVTHFPCIVRDVQTALDVGIAPPGTFDLSLLDSANPPTVGHFTQNRAYSVQLKAFSRTLHISWAEYATTHE